MGTYTPLGLKKQNSYSAYHHHQDQKRPHHKTITHPHGPPPELPQPDCHLLSGSEGLIWPQLPHFNHEYIPVIEHLLYDQCYQYVHTAKDKEI